MCACVRVRVLEGVYGGICFRWGTESLPAECQSKSCVTVHRAPFYDFCLSLTLRVLFVPSLFFVGDIRDKKKRTIQNQTFFCVSFWSRYLSIDKSAMLDHSLKLSRRWKYGQCVCDGVTIVSYLGTIVCEPLAGLRNLTVSDRRVCVCARACECVCVCGRERMCATQLIEKLFQFFWTSVWLSKRYIWLAATLKGSSRTFLFEILSYEPLIQHVPVFCWRQNPCVL